MTPLRRRMTEDMQVRGTSHRIPKTLTCNRSRCSHAILLHQFGSPGKVP